MYIALDQLLAGNVNDIENPRFESRWAVLKKRNRSCNREFISQRTLRMYTHEHALDGSLRFGG